MSSRGKFRGRRSRSRSPFRRRRSRSRSPFRGRQAARRHSRSPQQLRTKSWEHRDRSRSPKFARNRRSSPQHQRSGSLKRHDRSRRSSSLSYKHKDRSPRHSPARGSSYRTTSPQHISSSRDLVARISPKRGSKSSHTELLIRTSPSRDSRPVFNLDLIPRKDNSALNQHSDLEDAKKRLNLNQRFGANEKKFVLEENISIGLQWNPNAPVSTVVTVKKVKFDFSSFSLKRRMDEGAKQIFDRPEIKAFRHDEKLDDPDEYERRVITVLPKKRELHETSEADVDFSVRKSLSNFGSSSRERGRKDYSQEQSIRITRRRTPSPGRGPEIRLDPRPDPRYEAKYLAAREMEEESQFTLNPNDLRHSLLMRKEYDGGDDARIRIEARRRDNRETDERSGRGERFIHGREQPVREERFGRNRDSSREDRHARDRNVSTRDQTRPGQGRDAWDVANDRGREKERKSLHLNIDSNARSDNLPDFSRRPSKFVYDEWKDKPEMVPKGISYFEHDNREDAAGSDRRGRGQRPFRSRAGRGTFSSRNTRGRGFDSRSYSRPVSFRGRGGARSRGRDRESFVSRRRDKDAGYRSRVDFSEWKHDMYDKLEKEDDNRPTSTT